MSNADPILSRVREAFGDSVLGENLAFGEREVTVRREILPALARLLKEEPGLEFNFLMDLTAVDYLGIREVRFEMVYHFYSLAHNERIRVCVPVGEEQAEVPSLTTLWRAADWYEREAHEFYGIRFAGNHDLRKLLLYDQFKGYPLRKDYKMKARQPLVGPGSKGSSAEAGHE